MNEISIVLISIIVFFVSYRLFRLSIGSVNIQSLNLGSILYLRDVVLMTFVGTLLVTINFDNIFNTYFWGISSNVNDDSRYYAWLAIIYTLLVLPLGMLLANVAFVKKIDIGKMISSYYLKKPKLFLSKTDNSVFIVLILFLFISFLSIVYVYYVIGSFPIVKMFSGFATSQLLSQLRSNAKINFQGIAAVKDLLAINMTVLLSYIIYAYYISTRLVKYRFLFYLSFVLAFLSLTYNLEKSPFVFYLFGLLLVNMVIKGKVKFRKIFFQVGLLIVVLIFVFSYFTQSNVLYEFLMRIFVAQTAAIFQAFEYFPTSHDYLGLSSVSSLFAALGGGEVQQSGRVLYELYSPESISNNTAGYIVGLFPAEAWMLFGLPGLLLSPLFVGFFVQFLNLMILKMPKTPLFIGLYAYFMIRLTLNGFTQFIYPILLVSLIGIFILILFFSKTFQKVDA